MSAKAGTTRTGASVSVTFQWYVRGKSLIAAKPNLSDAVAYTPALTYGKFRDVVHVAHFYPTESDAMLEALRAAGVVAYANDVNAALVMAIESNSRLAKVVREIPILG
jgi:hypothetical protein